MKDANPGWRGRWHREMRRCAVSDVFMASDPNVVGRLDIEKNRSVELHMKERIVRMTSIPEFQRDEPGDALWTRKRRLAAERGHKVSRMKKIVTCCAVNRDRGPVTIPTQIIIQNHEMMDPDGALRCL